MGREMERKKKKDNEKGKERLRRGGEAEGERE